MKKWISLSSSNSYYLIATIIKYYLVMEKLCCLCVQWQMQWCFNQVSQYLQISAFCGFRSTSSSIEWEWRQSQDENILDLILIPQSPVLIWKADISFHLIYLFFVRNYDRRYWYMISLWLLMILTKIDSHKNPSCSFLEYFYHIVWNIIITFTGTKDMQSNCILIHSLPILIPFFLFFIFYARFAHNFDLG